MAQNEEGEFELVIGNRQLLLVFGVLLVLMGVLFTMGYLIGKNNPSRDAISAANRKQVPIDAGSGSSPSANPIIVDPGKTVEERPSRSASDLYEKATEAKKLPAVPVLPKADEKIKEVEKKIEPKKDPPKPVEPKVAEKKPSEPKPDPKPDPKPVVSAGSAREPSPGTYLQVVAVDKEGADVMAGSLRNKSFNAVVAPGPNPTLFRVLVGPMKDKEALAQTKIDLEKVGVKGSIVKKY